MLQEATGNLEALGSSGRLHGDPHPVAMPHDLTRLFSRNVAGRQYAQCR